MIRRSRSHRDFAYRDIQLRVASIFPTRETPKWSLALLAPSPIFDDVTSICDQGLIKKGSSQFHVSRIPAMSYLETSNSRNSRNASYRINGPDLSCRPMTEIVSRIPRNSAFDFPHMRVSEMLIACHLSFLT
jgi:hypothetical protein